MIEKYKPLFIHLNPASIPEVVAHMQRYLIEHTFVTVEEFGSQFQEYIEAHPEIIKVGSVNGLTGNVVLTSENITMTGESSDTIGTVIGDILEDASATGETVDDLAVDMDTAKTDIATLQSDVSTLQSDVSTLQTDVTSLEAVFTGATEESSGVKGLVPAPANTQISHYLKATGDFEAIPAREVISSAVSGAGTVEQALTAICTTNTYTQPKSVGENVTLLEFFVVHNPILKHVTITVRCNITTISSREVPLVYLPDSVPPPPADVYFLGMDGSETIIMLFINHLTNTIENRFITTKQLNYMDFSVSYTTT